MRRLWRVGFALGFSATSSRALRFYKTPSKLPIPPCWDGAENSLWVDTPSEQQSTAASQLINRISSLPHTWQEAVECFDAADQKKVYPEPFVACRWLAFQDMPADRCLAIYNKLVRLDLLPRAYQPDIRDPRQDASSSVGGEAKELEAERRRFFTQPLLAFLVPLRAAVSLLQQADGSRSAECARVVWGVLARVSNILPPSVSRATSEGGAGEPSLWLDCSDTFIRTQMLCEALGCAKLTSPREALRDSVVEHANSVLRSSYSNFNRLIPKLDAAKEDAALTALKVNIARRIGLLAARLEHSFYRCKSRQAPSREGSESVLSILPLYSKAIVEELNAPLKLLPPLRRLFIPAAEALEVLTAAHNALERLVEGCAANSSVPFSGTAAAHLASMSDAQVQAAIGRVSTFQEVASHIRLVSLALLGAHKLRYAMHRNLVAQLVDFRSSSTAGPKPTDEENALRAKIAALLNDVSNASNLVAKTTCASVAISLLCGNLQQAKADFELLSHVNTLKPLAPEMKMPNPFLRDKLQHALTPRLLPGALHNAMSSAILEASVHEGSAQPHQPTASQGGSPCIADITLHTNTVALPLLHLAVHSSYPKISPRTPSNVYLPAVTLAAGGTPSPPSTAPSPLPSLHSLLIGGCIEVHYLALACSASGAASEFDDVPCGVWAATLSRGASRLLRYRVLHRCLGVSVLELHVLSGFFQSKWLNRVDFILLEGTTAPNNAGSTNKRGDNVVTSGNAAERLLSSVVSQLPSGPAMWFSSLHYHKQAPTSPNDKDLESHVVQLAPPSSYREALLQVGYSTS